MPYQHTPSAPAKTIVWLPIICLISKDHHSNPYTLPSHSPHESFQWESPELPFWPFTTPSMRGPFKANVAASRSARVRVRECALLIPLPSSEAGALSNCAYNIGGGHLTHWVHTSSQNNSIILQVFPITYFPHIPPNFQHPAGAICSDLPNKATFIACSLLLMRGISQANRVN